MGSMNADLIRAIETAHRAIETSKRVVKAEFRADLMIVQKCDGYGKPSHLAVYDESAWTPQDKSLLPWEAPTGDVIGRVNHLTGEYTEVR